MSLSPVRLSVLRIDLPLCPGSITIIGPGPGPGSAGFGLVGGADDPIDVGEADVGCAVGVGVGESSTRLGVGLSLDVTASGSAREDLGLNEPHAARLTSSASRPASGANRRRGKVRT